MENIKKNFLCEVYSLRSSENIHCGLWVATPCNLVGHYQLWRNVLHITSIFKVDESNTRCIRKVSTVRLFKKKIYFQRILFIRYAIPYTTFLHSFHNY
jgi:hypothetical protein